MASLVHDALERAARLERLEAAADLLPEPAARRWNPRAWLAAALALLVALYPGMSAAAALFI